MQVEITVTTRQIILLTVFSFLTVFILVGLFRERAATEDQVEDLELERVMYTARQIQLTKVDEIYDPERLNGVQGMRAYNDAPSNEGLLAVASGYLYGADLFDSDLKPVFQTSFPLGRSGKTLFADVVRLLDGRYAYTDFKGHQIILMSPSGEHLDTWDHLSLNLPIGIDQFSDGTIVVVDYGNDAIKLISSEGSLIRSIYRIGDIELKTPYDVRVRDDALYLVDRTGHRLIVSDKHMDKAAILEKADDGSHIFFHPQHLDFDSNGLLYVMDTKSRSIKVVNPESLSVIAMLVHPEIATMRGIAIGTEDRIYVSGFKTDHPVNIDEITESHSGIIVFSSVTDQLQADVAF